METHTAIAIAAVALAVSVLAIGLAKFLRWPEGRKRAFRAKKRKWFLIG